MSDFLSERLYRTPELYEQILPYCRLKQGEIWKDPSGKHVVGCGDAVNSEFVKRIYTDLPKPKTKATQSLIFLHIQEQLYWHARDSTEGA